MDLRVFACLRVSRRVSVTCLLGWLWKVVSAAREKKKQNAAEIRLQQIEANLGTRGSVRVTSNDGMYGAAVQAGAIGLEGFVS